MLPIYTAPTIDQHQRTLLASYDTWKKVLPRLEQPLARVVEQQMHRNKNQALIRVEFSVANAQKVMVVAESM